MTASESHFIASATEADSASQPIRPLRSVRTMLLVLLSVAISGVMLLGQPSVVQARALSVQDRGTAQLADQALEALQLWRSDESPAHYVAYLQGRDLVARSIASQLDLEPTVLEDAWRDLSLTRQIVTLTAVAQAGIKYRTFGKHPSEGFDCSGLTGFAWNAAGLAIGHDSRGQFRAATKVSKDEAQAGDLIWYPGHISLYLGAADLMIHSPYTGRNVEIRQMSAKRIRNVKFASPLG
jgi:cell wall-associated NlpC family hydrolase